MLPFRIPLIAAVRVIAFLNMKSRFLVSLVLLAGFRAWGETGTEIGFIEKFALAADRESVLEQLIPGSEDFYFFHALQYQNKRDTAKLKATLAQWAKRFPDAAQRKSIENREALLDYDAHPAATLKFLRDRLHPELNHEQESREQKPDLPDCARSQAHRPRGLYS